MELQSFDVIANHELSRRIDYLDGVVHALTFGAEVAGCCPVIDCYLFCGEVDAAGVAGRIRGLSHGIESG